MIGTKIREYRLKKGLSANKLARSVGVSRTYISRLEHGHEKPSKKLLNDISTLLNLTDAETAQLLSLAGYDLRGMVAVGKSIKIPSDDSERNTESNKSGKGVIHTELKANGNSTKPAKVAHRLNIKLKEGTPVVYTDIALINSNENGVVINFGQFVGGLAQAEITTRVGMSLQHAKTLVRALSENIKKAEGTSQK